MLTVVRSDYVDPAGIHLLNGEFRVDAKRTMAIIWCLLQTDVAGPFPANVWNMHGIDLQIVSKTNNPLERFNPELNAVITAPHPRLSAFVA
ncbi:hypothetical protein PHMEG_0006790 [Phytophthora megakarya]|uniref:Uncharacterized protein n=1 Tax=Phytophthora megakarya TaxID=4795 RepID=A0A225WPI3_9STRA|nr:hypothetical protein PHMEG_0006790 [Phytophthora megakarya]